MSSHNRESQILKKLTQKIYKKNSNIVVPIGDDAAVVKINGTQIATCQDMLIEGAHFDLSYTTAFDLGYKSLAVNLSDLGAMGAKPLFAQISLGINSHISDEWVLKFYEGLTHLAESTKVQIIGGDLVHSPHKITIDVSVIGSCEKPYCRGPYQVGDLIAVTGYLGLSHTGFVALKNKMPQYNKSKLAHLRPEPRLEIHRAKSLPPSTVMDLSDGLIAALKQTQDVFGCGFTIETNLLPTHEESQSLAKTLSQDSHLWALYGGEDYGLLQIISPQNFQSWQAFWHSHNVSFTVVGKVIKESEISYQDLDNQKYKADLQKTWSHF